ncbi:MAG: PEP-CTERM sorting domain-containing protein [Armatimonadetes bacterium]|nr:PEP-CTERM sorting domain-containing protein [Armatimonadota bacterium]
MKYSPLILTFCATTCVSQAAILIDDFTSGFNSLTSGQNVYYVTQANNALGGWRYVDHRFAFPSNPPVTTSLSGSNPGAFSISADPSAFGFAALRWGGSTSSSSGSNQLAISGFGGLGGIDFATDGAFRVSYANNSFPSGPPSFEMRAWDTSGNLSATGFKFANSQSGSIQFDVSEFAGTANFSQINVLQLMVQAPGTSTIDITRVETVPEPATLAIIGSGALLALRKRRRKSS